MDDKFCWCWHSRYIPSLVVLEGIFATAAEKAISINSCSTNQEIKRNTSVEEAKHSELISVSPFKLPQCAKRTVNILSQSNNEFSSKTPPCVSVIDEKSKDRKFDEKSDSKTSCESFDYSRELEEEATRVEQEPLFLSLASHSGKVFSFSDNDGRHGNLDQLTNHNDKGKMKRWKLFELCFVEASLGSNKITL